MSNQKKDDKIEQTSAAEAVSSEKKEKISKEKTVARKRLLHGVYSGVAILLVLAIVIAVNAFLSTKEWNKDYSSKQTYTLSDQSKKICKSLKDEVNIYILCAENNFQSVYKSIANQYKKLNKNISIEYKDQSLYPNFANEYLPDGTTSATDGSMVVKCGDKYKFISYDDFYKTQQDYTSGQSTTTIELESLMTAAINYCVSTETLTAYQLTGQGEIELGDTLTSSFNNDDYKLEQLNLISTGSVPDDCAILIISGPTADLTPDMITAIQSYMDKGGKIYAMVDAYTEGLTNYFGFLEKNGITVNQGVVIETDASHYYNGNPTYLLPNINSTAATKDLSAAGYYVIAPIAKGLTLSTTAGVTSMLDTTDSAYSKVNTQSNTVEKEDGDIDGPFSIAAIVGSEDEPKMLVMSCPNMLDSSVDSSSSYTNSNFVMNGVNYLTEQDNKISIRSKDITENYATYTDAQQKMIMAIAIFIFPLFVIMLGVIVVIVRKHSR